MSTERIRHDFDKIAALGGAYDSGSDRYDRYLLSLVPPAAVRVLDVGCGAGRLSNRLAGVGRYVVAVDLSPRMIARARAAAENLSVQFTCGDFLDLEFGQGVFDCILSAATLHHMTGDAALVKMGALVKPGGRVIVHDMRRGAGVIDALGMGAILGYEATRRLLRTGWPLSPRSVRKAWSDHVAGDDYLSLQEAEELFERCLPGTRVDRHWGWRYTAIWDRPVGVDL